MSNKNVRSLIYFTTFWNVLKDIGEIFYLGRNIPFIFKLLVIVHKNKVFLDDFP